MEAAPGPPYRPSYPLPETLTLSMGKESKRVDVRHDQQIQELWQRITSTRAFNQAISELNGRHNSGPPPPRAIHYTLSHRISFYVEGDDKSYDLTSLGIDERDRELRVINSACERIIALMKAKVTRAPSEASPLSSPVDRIHPQVAPAEMTDLTRRVEQLEAATRFARGQETDAALRLTAAEAALSDTRDANGVLRGELEANAARLREAQERTAAAVRTLAEAQADLDRSSQQNQDLSSELDQLSGRLEGLQRTSEAAATALGRATQELMDLRTTNSQLQPQLQASTALVDQLRAQITAQEAAHHTDLDNLGAQLTAAIQTNSSLREQIAIHEGRISQLEGELGALRAIDDRCRAAEASAADLTARLAASGATATASASEVTQLRVQIEGSAATAAGQLQQILELTSANRRLTEQLEANATETARIRGQLTDQTRTSEAATQRLQEGLTELGARNSELQAAVDRNVAEIAALRGSLATSNGENSDLSAQLRASEASLASARAAAEASAGSQRALQATLDGLQAENQTLIGSLATSQARIRANESGIEELTRQMSELARSNASLSSEIAANQRELGRIRGDLAATTDRSREENTALQARISGLTRENQQLQQSLEANTRTISSLQGDIAASEDENGRLREQLATSSSLVEQGRARIEALEAELATSTSSLGEATAQVASLSSEVDGLHARVRELATAEAQRDALAQELEALRSALVSNIRELEGMLGITSTTTAYFDPQARIAAIQSKISEGSALQREQQALIALKTLEASQMQETIDAQTAQAQELTRVIEATRVSNRQKDEALERLSGQNGDLLEQLQVSKAATTRLQRTLEDQLSISDIAKQSYVRQLETLGGQNSDLNEAIARNREDMTSLQDSLGVSDRENADLRGHLATSQVSLSAAESALRASAETERSLRVEIAGLRAENLALSQSSTASQATIRGNQERIAALEAELATTSARTADLQSQISRLTDTNAALSQRIHELEGVETELQVLTVSNAELRQNYDGLGSDLERLIADQGTALTALEGMLGISPRETPSNPATRIAAIQAQIRARNEALSTLAAETRGLAAAVVAGQALIKSKLDKFREAEGTIATQAARIASLEENVASLREENGLLATRLAALDRTEENNRTLLADNQKLQLQLSTMQASLGHFAAGQEEKLRELEEALDITVESSNISTRAANISRALAAKSRALDETHSHLESQTQQIDILRAQLVTQDDTHRREIAKTEQEIHLQSEKIGQLSAELSLQGGANRMLRAEIESIKRERDLAIKRNSLLQEGMRAVKEEFDKFYQGALQAQEQYNQRIQEAEGNVARIAKLQDDLGKSTALNLSLQGSLTALQGIAAAKEAGDARLEEEAKIKSDLEARLREHERILGDCYATVKNCMTAEGDLTERPDIHHLPKLIETTLDTIIEAAIEPTRILREKELEYERANNLLQDKESYLLGLHDRIGQLERALGSSRGENAELQAQLTAASQQREKLEGEILEYREGAIEFAEEFKKDSAALRSQVMNSELTKGILIDEMRKIRIELEKLEQIAAAKAAADALTASTQDELAAAQAASKIELARIEKTLQELQALNYPETIRQLNVTESQLRAELSIKERKVATLTDALSRSQEENHELAEMNEILLQLLEKSEKHIEEIRAEMAALLTENRGLHGRVTNLTEENADQAARIDAQAQEIFALQAALAARYEIVAEGTLAPPGPPAGAGAGAGVVTAESDAAGALAAEIAGLEEAAAEFIPAETATAAQDLEFRDAATYQNFIIQRALISNRIKYMLGKGRTSLFYIPKSIIDLDKDEFEKLGLRDPIELEKRTWALQAQNQGKVIEIGGHTTITRTGKNMKCLANRLCLNYLNEMHTDLRIYADLQQAVNLKARIKDFTNKINELKGQASTKKFINSLEFNSTYFWKDLVVYKMIFTRLPTLKKVAVPLEAICQAFVPAITNIHAILKSDGLGGAGGPGSPATPRQRRSGGPGGGTPGSMRKKPT